MHTFVNQIFPFTLFHHHSSLRFYVPAFGLKKLKKTLGLAYCQSISTYSVNSLILEYPCNYWSDLCESNFLFHTISPSFITQGLCPCIWMKKLTKSWDFPIVKSASRVGPTFKVESIQSSGKGPKKGQR